MDLDPSSFTIDELELIEDITGVDFDEIQAGKARTSKVLRAFALVALRRENPAATIDDAGKVSVRGLEAFLGNGRPFGPSAAGPPASNGSSPSPRRRASRSPTSKG